MSAATKERSTTTKVGSSTNEPSSPSSTSQAKQDPRTRPETPGSRTLVTDQDSRATHTPPIGDDLFAQQASAVPITNGSSPAGPALRLVHGTPDVHHGDDESQHLSQPTTMAVTNPTDATSDGWLELRIWAEMFTDAQLARIGAVNRAERGGVDPTIYGAYLEALHAAEHQCGLAMRRSLRRNAPPAVLAWQKATKGIGEHQLALLLGHLGHPRIATPHHWEGTGSSRTLVADEPYERSVGQLWQYCGHGAPERKRKGMSAEELFALGKPNLKSIVWNISTACLKQKATSPYGVVYNDAREQYADRVHADECVRCGPSGRPAQPGSPWSLAHQHAAALRKVGKEILRDLWTVSA